eukprot:CAMPEP_0175162058 /NCGR_PEP_ID=MMETSP0087-20121206/24949_1 /TAXON_ID=136419 /ORGANISM="Unknown Unknown, Strain D1" /LENGTH=544 /DNA_ID=CAMNT_0016450541 /DNA_START=27 /DNA_END=1661 /DNA_ORIENTATION=-
MSVVPPPPGLKPKVKVISNIPSGGNKSNLSNSDFRSLLSQQRRIASDEPEVDEAELKQKQKAKQAKKLESYNRWQAKKNALEAAKAKTQYRDRAKERATGENPDYADIEQYEDVDIAQSKYLGGDVAHTHLVKGLDYALLDKMRSLVEKEEEDRLEKEFEEGQQAREEAEKEARKRAKEIRFVSHMGRSVYRLAIEEPRIKAQKARENKVELFLPGRMTFEFDVDSQLSSWDSLPTTLLVSKEDCATAEDTMNGMIDLSLHRRVNKIMGFLSDAYGSKSKKLRKKKKEKGGGGGGMYEQEDGELELQDPAVYPPLQTGPPPPAALTAALNLASQQTFVPPALDEEEDIFGGAGREYEDDDNDAAEGTSSSSSSSSSSRPDMKNLFSTGIANKLETTEEEAEAAVGDFDYTTQEEQLDKQTQAAQEERKRKMLEPDFYTEFEGGQGGGGLTTHVVEDGDEDNFDIGRSKLPARSFKVSDFDTEPTKQDGKRKKLDPDKQRAATKAQKFDKDFKTVEQMVKKRAAKKKTEDPRDQKRAKILSGFKK